MSNQIPITAPVIRKASKKKVKMRGALYGPSSSGKTFSMLRLGTGLCRHANGGTIPPLGSRGRILVGDTETNNESGDSELYANLFDFDVVLMPDGQRSIDHYIAVIKAAIAGGYAVLIFDSLSHAWRELLEMVDKAKASSQSGNSFQAWAQATPKQKELVEALRAFPGHLLCSMRADTAWEMEEDGGKKKPKRVGLKPEQGKGIEYEFTFLIALDVNNVAHVEKDRTGKFQGRTFDRLTEEVGFELGEWLNDGNKPITELQREEINGLCKSLQLRSEGFKALAGGAIPGNYEEAEAALEKLRALSDPAKAAELEMLRKLSVLGNSLNPPPAVTPPKAAAAGSTTSTKPPSAPAPATSTGPATSTTAGPSAPAPSKEATGSGSALVDAFEAPKKKASKKAASKKAADPPPTPPPPPPEPTPPPTADDTEGEEDDVDNGGDPDALTPDKDDAVDDTASAADDAAALEVNNDAPVEPTTLLLSFKKACDASKTATELAVVISTWAAKVENLRPHTLRNVARGYAEGRRKDLTGEKKTADEDRLMTSLNEMTKE